MDTLIDNRNFPKEMQEHAETPKPKKVSGIIIVLIFLALIVIASLVYTLFLKKDTKPQKKELPTQMQEQVKNIKAMKSQTRTITRQERDEKIAVFFK